MGRLWVPDAEVMHSGTLADLSRITEGKLEVTAEAKKALQSLEGEESDVVAWLGNDGTLALRSILVSSLNTAGHTRS